MISYTNSISARNGKNFQKRLKKKTITNVYSVNAREFIQECEVFIMCNGYESTHDLRCQGHIHIKAKSTTI